jgi:hypothetical protein
MLVKVKTEVCIIKFFMPLWSEQLHFNSDGHSRPAAGLYIYYHIDVYKCPVIRAASLNRHWHSQHHPVHQLNLWFGPKGLITHLKPS